MSDLLIKYMADFVKNCGYQDVQSCVAEMELRRGNKTGKVKKVMQLTAKYWQRFTHLDIEYPVR
jgi:hypothetical protein